jgi:acyl-CoA thioester hydrolase
MDLPVSRPFRLPIVVEAHDIDELDHVSNVRYVHWMNRAAVEHSNVLGWTLERYREIGGVFVVRRHEIDYLYPAVLGDRITLFTWPHSIDRASAERKHEIRRDSDGKVLARGLNLWVFVDVKTGRPLRIPPEVAASFDPKLFS